MKLSLQEPIESALREEQDALEYSRVCEQALDFAQSLYYWDDLSARKQENLVYNLVHVLREAHRCERH